MPTTTTTAARVVFAFILFGAIHVQAQQAAPIPAPILNAKNVFIANAGADALISSLDEGKATGDKYYNLFYGAMKNWGHYKLLDSPAEADLVVEIYASSPVTSVSNGAARIQPQLQVCILDGKSHFLLWRLTESLEANHPKLFGGVGGTDAKLSEGIDGLVRQFKSLAAPAAEPARK